MPLTRDRVRHGHQGRVQSGRDTPNDAVADQTSETEREEVAHERRTSELAQCHDRAHAPSDESNFARSFLPRSQCLGLSGLRNLRGSGRCNRWGSWARGWWKDIAILQDDSATNHLILKVDREPAVTRANREQELRHVV